MAELIQRTDSLNTGREKLNEAIKSSVRAEDNSEYAVETAEEALSKSESTQEQLDTIVIDGDSSVEAAQARVDEKGETHQTLKARIDSGFEETKDTFNSVNQQLAQTSSVLSSHYSLKGDGTDGLESLQFALDDLSSKGHKNLTFPPNGIYKAENSLSIPEYMDIDFNGSIIQTPQNINKSPIVLNGSATIRNVKVLQEEKENTPNVNVHGIEFKPNKSVKNLFFYNVVVEGFRNGIFITPENGNIVENVVIRDCTTNHADLVGLDISNARKVTLDNHESKYNKRDGFKTTRNVRGLVVLGGDFSDNRGINNAYADGIDLYAGAIDSSIIGAITENNSGVGLHIATGELHDPAYRENYYPLVQNILVQQCVSRFNDYQGFDVVNLRSVSDNPPLAKNIKFVDCLSENNNNGFHIVGQGIVLRNCTSSKNKLNGVLISRSKDISLDNNVITENSQDSLGVHGGIRIDNGITNLTINNGIIDGGESLAHRFAIDLRDIDISENITINHPEMVNYSEDRAIRFESYSVEENNNKLFIIHYGDIGEDNTNVYTGFKGSSLYKNNDYYIKKTGLNSTSWELQE